MTAIPSLVMTEDKFQANQPGRPKAVMGHPMIGREGILAWHQAAEIY